MSPAGFSREPDIEAAVSPGPTLGEGDEGEYYHQHETYRAWSFCAELVSKRDADDFAAWTAEIDTLLTFCGLLLTVVTLFIGLANSSLQPDNQAATVAALVTISQQLRNSTIPGAVMLPFIPDPFQRDIVSFDVNSILSISLLLSLGASTLGFWVKQWLRGYSLNIPSHARDRVRVYEYRHYGLVVWKMRHIVAAVSSMVMLAMAFASFGIVAMTWKANAAWSQVITVLLAVSLTLGGWSTAIIPIFSTHCPFKSTFARMLYQLHHFQLLKRSSDGWKWRRFESFVNRERRRVHEQGTALELQALRHVNNEHWGKETLFKINNCFKDVQNVEEARECIEDIVAERVWGMSIRGWLAKWAASEDRRLLTPLPKDDGVLHLLEIWDAIGMEAGGSSAQRTDEDHGGREEREQRRWESFQRKIVLEGRRSFS
ncbi:hypothetical protein C8Q80DRAFT_1115667 [Daedaleopsis nitida]|nr:hypothetical protein C8Q80DRAFT_1115667 [Daedaleopsis nitida]